MTAAEKTIIDQLQSLHLQQLRLQQVVERLIIIAANRQTLTLKEASLDTGLSQNYLKKLVGLKKIAAFKPGGGTRAKLYFAKDELERYKRQNPVSSLDEIDSKAATYNFLKRKSA